MSTRQSTKHKKEHSVKERVTFKRLPKDRYPLYTSHEVYLDGVIKAHLVHNTSGTEGVVSNKYEFHRIGSEVVFWAGSLGSIKSVAISELLPV